MNFPADLSGAQDITTSELLDGLSIVVPVYNKESELSDTLDSILEASSGARQIILVDDGSTDSSPDIIASYCRRFPEVSSITLTMNRGAGVARNSGIPLIRHKHTVFFDADDRLQPGSLDTWHQHACEHDSDIAMCQYKFILNGKELKGGMHKRDLQTWLEANGSNAPETVSLLRHGRLLEFTNYPWNKMYKTQFLIEKGILFSATPVHNDVFFHWVSLCAAEKLILIPEPYCTHFVSAGVLQITQDFSRRRLCIFDALDDVEHFFDLDPKAKRNFYANFLRFKIDLIRWAASRIPDSLRLEFESAVQAHYSKTNLHDTLLNFDRVPELAALSIIAAYEPHLLIKG